MRIHSKQNFFGSGGGAFDPESYGNLLGWWLADNAILDGRALSSVPNSALSAAYGPMTSYPASSVPSYKSDGWNGTPGIVWTSGGNRRLYSVLSAPAPVDWTVALVADQTSPIDGTQRFWLGMQGISPFNDYAIQGTPSMAGYNSSTSAQPFPTSAPAAGQQVLVFGKTSGAIQAWRDGVSLGVISGNDPGGQPSVAGSSIAYLMMLSAVNKNASMGGIWKTALAYGGALNVSPVSLSNALAAQYLTPP